MRIIALSTKLKLTNMKILVFDDNQTHRTAAQAQLKDHDLTVVGTYDEAQKLLTPQLDEELATRIYTKKYDGDEPYSAKYHELSPSERKERDDFYAQAEQKATTYPDFDVVLSDLLVPASRQAQGSMELVGKEMPVGIFIGLLAAVKARAKYVAVFTDSDHHSHPASASYDVFNKHECKPTAFTVEGSKVLLCNNRNWVNQFDPNDLGKALEFEEYSKRSDTVRAKNWGSLLEYLIS